MTELLETHGTRVATRVLLSDPTDTFCGEIVSTGPPAEIVPTLVGDERAVIVMPFDPAEPALAHRVRRCETELPRTAARSGPRTPRQHTVVEQPGASTYADQVSDALERIERGEVEKVVLGRGLRVTSVPAWEPDEILARLLESRPGRYVFSVPTADGTLVGASPELLVRRRGAHVTSLPLAGSKPRVADPDADRAGAAELQASPKDLHEHRFVVDEIVGALGPVAELISAPDLPELLATDTLWHLATPIEAVLADPEGRQQWPSAWELAELLHPTPAMGGVPTAAALSAIAEIEGTSRGPLTGAVGWVDTHGDGEFVLAIRSGVLSGDTFTLFAGAGIVAGSVPEAEVAETGAKLNTMLRVVGVR